jgi:hypothetical protein
MIDLTDHAFQFSNTLFSPLGDSPVQRMLEIDRDFGSKPYKEQGRIVQGSIQRLIHPISRLETDDEEAQVVYDIFQCTFRNSHFCYPDFDTFLLL